MKAFVSLLPLCATPLAVENGIVKSRGDAALLTTTEQFDQIGDGAAAWALDWDRQAPLDLIARDVASAP